VIPAILVCNAYNISFISFIPITILSAAHYSDQHFIKKHRIISPQLFTSFQLSFCTKVTYILVHCQMYQLRICLTSSKWDSILFEH